MTRSDSPPQPSDPAREQRRRLKGIALMTGAVAGFSCIDASAKFLINHMDIAQVVWARYAFAFIFSLFISNPFTHPALMRTSRPWLQIGRSALLVLSTALNVVALRYLQLDQTVSIMFSTPFLVAILAGPPGALHLQPAGVDGGARLSGVRRRAEPLDPHRRLDRDRVRPLSVVPRAPAQETRPVSYPAGRHCELRQRRCVSHVPEHPLVISPS
jgi:hypothetical protein